MSLEEREAFPIESHKTLESPGLPPDLRPSGGPGGAGRPALRLVTLVLVVVAAIGALLAARFFMTAAHRPSSGEIQ
jgi:hypothetical protein